MYYESLSQTTWGKCTIPVPRERIMCLNLSLKRKCFRAPLCICLICIRCISQSRSHPSSTYNSLDVACSPSCQRFYYLILNCHSLCSDFQVPPYLPQQLRPNTWANRWSGLKLKLSEIGIGLGNANLTHFKFSQLISETQSFPEIFRIKYRGQLNLENWNSVVVEDTDWLVYLEITSLFYSISNHLKFV